MVYLQTANRAKSRKVPVAKKAIQKSVVLSKGTSRASVPDAKAKV